MIKRIAELINVPFVKSDATKFTETGYQGGDVDDLIRQLYQKSNKNTQLAEFGIIYLDEIDKGQIENTQAPEIAINYWNLAKDASLRDVVIAVRNDEAGHRDKNHLIADDLDSA